MLAQIRHTLNVLWIAARDTWRSNSKTRYRMTSRRLRQYARQELTVAARLQETNRSMAELCLLRALWLHKEVKRAVLGRQHEALAAVTRSVIEASLIGLFVLGGEDQRLIDRLRKSGMSQWEKAFRTLSPDPLAVDHLLGALDPDRSRFSDTPRMPDTRQIAENVDRLWSFGGMAFAVPMYNEYYTTLSNLSIHTSVGSLGRHYSLRSRGVTARPWGIASRHTLTRVTEACLAFLAAALAFDGGREPSPLVHAGLARWHAIPPSGHPALIMYVTLISRGLGYRAMMRFFGATVAMLFKGGGEQSFSASEGERNKGAQVTFERWGVSPTISHVLSAIQLPISRIAIPQETEAKYKLE